MGKGEDTVISITSKEYWCDRYKEEMEYYQQRWVEALKEINQLKLERAGCKCNSTNIKTSR